MLPYLDNHPLGDIVTIMARDWPAGHKKGPMPGELRAYSPHGLCLDIPFVMRPGDRIEDTLVRADYYAAEAMSADPIANAPANDAGGGCVYFSGQTPTERIVAGLRLMGLNTNYRQFAVFYGGTQETGKERYLHQIRIVARHGLAALFRIREKALGEIAEQPLTVGETILKFIEIERGLWGEGFSNALAGTIGGDGDWARESLGFGILVENSYHGVCRVWSRPWLVTK